MAGCPLIVHNWGGFAIGARISLLRQHSAEREMSASACARSMPGLKFMGHSGMDHIALVGLADQNDKLQY